MKSSRIACAILGLAFVNACSAAGTDDETGSQISQELWSPSGTALWPNGAVKICFSADIMADSQWNTARQNIETWAQNEFAPFANVNFSHFGQCPASPGPEWLQIIKSTVQTRSFNLGYKTTSNGLQFTGHNPRRDTVLHEIGHALGYAHEFDRVSGGCHSTGTNHTGATDWSPMLDPYSIMSATYSSCQSFKNLSGWDRAGLALGYGQRAATFNASFSFDNTWAPWASVATKVNPAGSGLSNLTLADVLVGDFVTDPLEDSQADDLLVAAGSGWWVSSKGYYPWQQINSSTVAASNLLVGDFDGDGVSDVLRPMGTSFKMSYSGNTSWTTVNSFSSSIPKSELLVGKFDTVVGDDVLWIQGASTGCSSTCPWYLSSGATGVMTAVNSSAAPIIDLKVGEFNGDGRDDVLFGNGTLWKYSASATGSWQILNSSDVSGRDLLVGQFDGAGHDDIFTINDNKFKLSVEGTGSWAVVATTNYAISQMRVANFGLWRNGFPGGPAATPRDSVFTQ